MFVIYFFLEVINKLIISLFIEFDFNLCTPKPLRIYKRVDIKFYDIVADLKTSIEFHNIFTSKKLFKWDLITDEAYRI